MWLAISLLIFYRFENCTPFKRLKVIISLTMCNESLIEMSLSKYSKELSSLSFSTFPQQNKGEQERVLNIYPFSDFLIWPYHGLLFIFLMMMMMMMMTMMMNYFCGMVGWLCLTLFPARTTVRDPHHYESPTNCKQGSYLCKTWVQAYLNEVVQ